MVHEDGQRSRKESYRAAAGRAVQDVRKEGTWNEVAGKPGESGTPPWESQNPPGKLKSAFERHMQNPEFRKHFDREYLQTQLEEGICVRLKKEGIDHETLSRLMGRKKGWLKKRLNGSKRFTVEDLADIARCLGCEWQVELVADRITGYVDRKGG